MDVILIEEIERQTSWKVFESIVLILTRCYGGLLGAGPAFLATFALACAKELSMIVMIG
jgi:hypothetical protein